MKYSRSTIYIALPVINEFENIDTFIKNVRKQTFTNYKLYICINQPDIWWNIPEKKEICENNQTTIEYLKRINDSKIEIIDKCTLGNGWKGKQSGVGWARKILMDSINETASVNDIIVSLDADTSFNENYFESLIDNFQKHVNAMAVSVPYYHCLTNDDDANRAILRYEIYMRHYAINLWRIGSPFNFTALGSAIAFPIWAYRKIGGITPMKSGEDFYFLQKFCKTGHIINWNFEKVYPAARFSDRVFFGTGPAMIKGNNGDWESYPIYHYSFFEKVLETYQKLEILFENDIELSMNQFLNEQFRDDYWWLPLRKNFKNKEKFIKACYEKVDGLRVLQFLKLKHSEIKMNDEQCLKVFFQKYYPDERLKLNLDENFSFSDLDIGNLDKIRNTLMLIEENLQKQDFFN